MVATEGGVNHKTGNTKTNGEDNGKLQIIINMKEDSDTVVFLFGWAGCRDRYLAKYSQYYENAGISTIRYTVPIAKVRSFSSYHHFAKRFHRETMEKSVHTKDKKIYFHMFSMNGCSLFTALWDQLDRRNGGPDLKKQVHGVIFDSCPAYTSPSQSAVAVSFATLPPAQYHAVLRESYRAVLYTYFSFQRGMMYLRSLMNPLIYERNFAYFRLLALKEHPSRQLYIYGPGDDVCSQESIEAYAEEMNRRGVKVERELMHESLHVQHYRMYPTEYEAACLKFIGANANAVEVDALTARTAVEFDPATIDATFKNQSEANNNFSVKKAMEARS